MLLRVVRELAYFERIDSELDATVDNLHADAARNIETEDGCVSFFRCAGEGEEVEAAVAVAAGRGAADDVEYVVVDESGLIALGLGVEESAGKTHLSSANARHVNVVGVRLSLLSALSLYCAVEGKQGIVPRPKVLSELSSAKKNGALDPAKIRKALNDQLEVFGRGREK